MDLLKFVGREDIIGKINQEADALTDQNNKLTIIYGIKGIGKTSLLKELDKKFDSKQNFISAYVDLNELKYKQKEEVLEKITTKLKSKIDIPFILFNFAFYVYLRKMNPSYEPTIFENSIQEKNTTFKNILSLCSKIPVVGSVFQLGQLVMDVVDLIGTTYPSYIKSKTKMFDSDLKKLEYLEPLEIAKLLPYFFAKDVNLFLGENDIKAVFLLDSYDSILSDGVTRDAISEPEKWLFDSITGLFYYLKKTLFVATVWDEIPWMKKQLKDYSSHKLLELLPNETELLLQSIEELEVQKRIFEITKGHPYSIGVALALYEQNKNIESKDRIAIFQKFDSIDLLQDYFVQNMPEKDKTLLTLFSCCHFWNKDIFLYLNNQFTIGYSAFDFSKIVNHSYVETSDNVNFSLHSLMIESLQKWSDIEIKEKANNAMFEYYKGKLTNIEHRYLDDNDDRALWEACYHGLHTKNNNSDMNEFFEWFFNITDFFDRAGKWQVLVEILEMFINPKLNLKLLDPLKAVILGSLATYCSKMRLWNKAMIYFEETLKIRRILAEINIQSYSRNLADTLNNFGNLSYRLHNMSKAQKCYEEALKIYRTPTESNPTKYLPDIALILNNLGVLVYDLNEFEKAQKCYEEALKIYRTLEESNPMKHLPDIAMTLNNFGNLARNLQKWNKALECYEEALKIRRFQAIIDPQIYLPNVGGILNNLGLLLSDLHEWSKTRECYEEALKIWRDLATTNPQSYLPDVAMTVYNLGLLYETLKDIDKAKECFQESLAIYEQINEQNHRIYTDRIERLKAKIASL
jgi:tetratricopeptide (TPR) repeat protein